MIISAVLVIWFFSPSRQVFQRCRRTSSPPARLLCKRSLPEYLPYSRLQSAHGKVPLRVPCLRIQPSLPDVPQKTQCSPLRNRCSSGHSGDDNTLGDIRQRIFHFKGSSRSAERADTRTVIVSDSKGIERINLFADCTVQARISRVSLATVWPLLSASFITSITCSSVMVALLYTTQPSFSDPAVPD